MTRAAVFWQGGDARWQPRDLTPLTTAERAHVPAAGARAVRSAIERCEIMEDQGRRPDLVSRALRRGLSVSMPKGITLPRRDRTD